VNLDEPLSPELVLVAPPELAAYARGLLPEKPFPLPAQRVTEMSARFGFGFAGFLFVCIGATVGPFVLALVARAHG
jgi:hypothetical protein